MARVLVTGGAGFIGSHLAEALVRRGETVRVFDNFSTGRRANLEPVAGEVDLVEGDLRNEGDCQRAVSGVEVIFHQAALPSVPRSIADPASTNAVNVDGLVNLLIAARDHGARRVIFASSSSVYGDQAVEEKHEGLPLRPLSPYAASKAAGELYLRAFGAACGLETVALRYFNVFGPRQDPDSPYAAVIPRFITALLRGDAPVIHGDGQQARDFTYVENVVDANLLAMTARLPGPGAVYNIACGEATTVIALAERIAVGLSRPFAPVFAPPRAGDVRLSKANIQAAADGLGYAPRTGYAEGLAKTIAWYADGETGSGVG